jgi:flavin-binding protein dodecin
MGYQGVDKRDETQDVTANWHIAMRPGKCCALNKDTPMGKLLDECERLKARNRAKMEHFRVIQAPVRPPQGALPRVDEEHAATAHAVCLEQSVDDSPADFAARQGMSPARIRPNRAETRVTRLASMPDMTSNWCYFSSIPVRPPESASGRTATRLCLCLTTGGYMSNVVKLIEILAESPNGWDDAAKQAVAEASKSLREIKSLYVKEMSAEVDNGQIVNYRLNAKVSFKLE